MALDATTGPALLAAMVLLIVFLISRRLRGTMGWFVTIYALIGCGTYLYWIIAEAAPPHGSYVPSFASLADIGWQLVVAAVAILGWPLWPMLRVVLFQQ